LSILFITLTKITLKNVFKFSKYYYLIGNLNFFSLHSILKHLALIYVLKCSQKGVGNMHRSRGFPGLSITSVCADGCPVNVFFYFPFRDLALALAPDSIALKLEYLRGWNTQGKAENSGENQLRALGDRSVFLRFRSADCRDGKWDSPLSREKKKTAGM